MKGCWVYTLTYNCEDIVPHFLHHYRGAERVVVYDNGSTDKTIDLLRQSAWVEVRSYAELSGNQLRDDIHGHIKNTCWKEAKGKADWVIVVDADEFLYHPDIDNKLAEYKATEVTIPLTTAYEMVGAIFPKPPTWLSNTIKLGRRNDLYSKLVIFDPNKITQINYGPGGHESAPIGDIKYSGQFYRNAVPVPPYPPLIVREFREGKYFSPPPNELKVLHYRFVGLERIEAMWERYKKRMSKVNLENGWGRHYFLPKEEQERIYKLLESQAEQVVM